MTFSKLLIANRGEIACRVIATARRMGIATVAVCSDADAGARHVEMADEAVRIGPAAASESYLNIKAILGAAQATGAEAIHPGYGFLSENAEFVDAVDTADLTFVGPPAAAIRAMGLKDAAKALMAEANVPIVPGYHGESRDPDALAAEADKVGYPVLIKARAGGGGKGMRRVENASNFRSALEAAQREAQASFGDPHCLIEKFITAPRHVEIQVFADSHGNIVHLFERDCSLQRRHQKVIEEAPAPDMPPEVRAAMGQAAVDAARAVGYVGAGTVEFIADGSDGLKPNGFWFMEMNTRLQVEHPVTEAITGLDLVELQLRIAAGEPLPVTQDDLTITGHSFEARLYAEAPERGFLPSIGRLEHLSFPVGQSFAQGATRIDAGVRSGDQITPHYDPMIAKIITHGPDRAQALLQLTRALEATEIAGVTTNLPFLIALSRDPDFAAGNVDTGLIERKPALAEEKPPPEIVRELAALAALGLTTPPNGAGPWDQLRGWRAWGPAVQTADLGDAGPVEIDLSQTPQISPLPDGRLKVTKGGLTETLRIVRAGQEITVIHRGNSHVFTLPDPLAPKTAASEKGDQILAPMPGRVTRLDVAPGDQVADGQALMTLEAMKMEHVLKAPRPGTIAKIHAAQGDQVADGALLIELENPND